MYKCEQWSWNTGTVLFIYVFSFPMFQKESLSLQYKHTIIKTKMVRKYPNTALKIQFDHHLCITLRL